MSGPGIGAQHGAASSAGDTDAVLEWLDAEEVAEVQHIGWLPGLTPWPVIQLTKVSPKRHSCLIAELIAGGHQQ